MASRIALDAFGGDNCPDVEIDAAIAAAREGIEIVLVGPSEKLEPVLTERLDGEQLAIRIHHAPDRITMDDKPAAAVRGKPEASMPVCYDLVKAGEADAVVSAGNSGAMLACGLFKYGRIKGVDRPALATSFPTLTGHCCIVDVGANTECRPLHLAQFAVMGALFARVNMGLERPKVAVLSNGAEEGKGNDLTRAVNRALSSVECSEFEYLGYLEPGEIWAGTADVVVADGFVGNIALKLAEGTVRAFAEFIRRTMKQQQVAAEVAQGIAPVMAAINAKLDPDQYGGAPLLGAQGVAIICHGGSSVEALLNGIRLAARFVDESLTPGLTEAINHNQALFDAAREDPS